MKPWGISFTNADRVHSVFSDVGTGIKVGVFDTGIDSANSDLHLAGGVDETGDSFNYYDDPFGHGTQVAGVIAAMANGSKVIGMAPGVSLYSIRVFPVGIDQTWEMVDSGLEWALANGIQVLNSSLGDCGITRDSLPTEVHTDIANLVSAGVVVVAAAGNGSANPPCTSSDSISNYAAEPGVIAVSAINQDSTSPSGYQYGSKIWVAAPTNVETDSAGTTSNFDGTSAATPHVSGAAALLMYEGLSAASIKSVISYETQDKPDTTLLAHNNHVGYGTLDVAAAIQLTPQIWEFTTDSACDGVIYAGQTCHVKPMLGIAGIAPVTYTWQHAETNSGSISVSESDSIFTFSVGGDGSTSFTITIDAWPHDTVTARHPRIGLTAQTSYIVCPGGDFSLRPPPWATTKTSARFAPAAHQLTAWPRIPVVKPARPAATIDMICPS
ncbi:MAG TPA: S8 family serine peptidase [Gemmatimonadales bacterium]